MDSKTTGRNEYNPTNSSNSPKTKVDNIYLQYQEKIIATINEIIDFQEFEKDLKKAQTLKKSVRKVKEKFIKENATLVENSLEIQKINNEYIAILEEIKSKKITFYSNEINWTFCVSLQCWETIGLIIEFSKKHFFKQIEEIYQKYNPIKCFADETVKKVINIFHKKPKIENGPQKSLES